MNPQDFLQDCRLKVWPDRYAIVKAKTIPPECMAAIQDYQEFTVVLKESQVRGDFIISLETGWKVISFEVVLPFELVGFLATIAQALAQEKVSIFALSAYSTDHLLVKEIQLEKTLHTLTRLGCKIDPSNL